MTNNKQLVYSTDPKDVLHNGKKKEPSFKATVNISQFTIIFRIEKAGRGGKTVTVMDGWPANEDFIAQMCKEMKAKCGTGGTYLLKSPMSTIEIQGDKRDHLKKILTSKNIKFKGF